MRDIFTIVRKELSGYFNAPVAFVFLVVFVLVSCGLFMTTFFLSGICSMRAFFTNLPLLLMVFVPAVTMRLWAEERKSSTISLLLSLPTSSTSLVIGKFLAAFLFGALAIASTVTIPIMLKNLGNPDLGPVMGGYMGSLLMLAFLLSLGMAISAFFQDQIVAFILALMAGLGAFLAGTDFIATFLDGWVTGLGTFLKEAMGIPSHFSSFAKGVLDMRDVIFFAAFSVIFLIVNILTLEGHIRMKKAKGFWLGIIFLLAIGLFLNGIMYNIRLKRIDLTSDKLYTVSTATKKVFERLKVPISVTYYVSSKEKLPTPMKEIARDVKDILEELSQLSPKFTYRIVSPSAIPDKIPDLQKKGIVPFNAQTIEQDALNIKRIYSALSIAYLDKKEEIIPQIVPQSLGSLEYDLVSKIFRLTMDKQPKVALLAPSSNLDPQTAMLMRQMRQQVPGDEFNTLTGLLQEVGYDVEKIRLDKNSPIPDDAKLLVILEPGQLNERQRYEIANFLSRGGRLFLAVQRIKYNYNEGAEGMTAMAQQIPTNINELLAAYGLGVDEEMLFDKRHAVLSIATQRKIGMFTALVQMPVNFPMQIQVLPDQMNNTLSVTDRISGLLYLWGTALEPDKKEMDSKGLKATVLFSSSQESWTRPYHFGPLTMEDLHPPMSGEGIKSRPLAMLVEGIFPNPYTGKQPPPWPGKEKDEKTGSKQDKQEKSNQKGQEPEKPEKVSRPEKGQMILTGCAEMFKDNVIGAMGNASFLLNSVDALGLGEELIHIRSKTQVQRFLPPMSAKAKILWRGFVVFTAPVLWIFFGIVRALNRKRRREQCPNPVKSHV